jgi:hypothetical protein
VITKGFSAFVQISYRLVQRTNRLAAPKPPIWHK